MNEASRIVATLGALVALSCTGSPTAERRSAAEHGREIFAAPTASDSRANRFSCATCHVASPDAADMRILPGYPLAGAPARSTYWGGKERDLLEAINDCRYYFMAAVEPWAASDERAVALYAFLSDLPPTAVAPLPFTVLPVVTDLAAGDPARGAAVYEGSCRVCHGELHAGTGKLSDLIPALPEEPLREYDEYAFDTTQKRMTFVEKVRHGGFLGLHGNMPLWSREAMSDSDLASLLAYLGLY